MDTKDKCLFVTPSGVDVDGDGIDDACDDVIAKVTATTIIGKTDSNTTQGKSGRHTIEYNDASGTVFKQTLPGTTIKGIPSPIHHPVAKTVGDTSRRHGTIPHTTDRLSYIIAAIILLTITMFVSIIKIEMRKV